MPVVPDGRDNTLDAGFMGEVCQAKDALKLLQDENDCCASHEASDCGMREEIHQYP